MLSSLAAIPKCISRTCPIFIRDGTPCGLSIMSIVLPSGKYGISSSGNTRDITPLLPWRPAILSPTWIFLFWAIYTRITFDTPVGSSSLSFLENILTSWTIPSPPCGTRSDVSLTSRVFSPNIACNNFSSEVSSAIPFGVTLPTRISPSRTSVPTITIPFSSRFFLASSLTLGISRVISSGPNLVSRHCIS